MIATIRRTIPQPFLLERFWQTRAWGRDGFKASVIVLAITTVAVLIIGQICFAVGTNQCQKAFGKTYTATWSTGCNASGLPHKEFPESKK